MRRLVSLLLVVMLLLAMSACHGSGPGVSSSSPEESQNVSNSNQGADEMEFDLERYTNPLAFKEDPEANSGERGPFTMCPLKHLHMAWTPNSSMTV